MGLEVGIEKRQPESAGIAFAVKKGFFFSYNMIFDLDISEHAKLLYLYLCRRADGNSCTFPSYATMAEACSMSRATAIRTVKELMVAGLLSRTRQQKRGKEYTSNLYLLYPFPDEEIKRRNIEELEQEKEPSGCYGEEKKKDAGERVQDSREDSSSDRENTKAGKKRIPGRGNYMGKSGKGDEASGVESAENGAREERQEKNEGRTEDTGENGKQPGETARGSPENPEIRRIQGG